jgi:prevent-host-death family protein
MQTVGIRELKAHLSMYIDHADKGEEFVVTDRGREVALIVPITPERRSVIGVVAEGGAEWSGGKPRGYAGATVTGKALSDTVLEERR